MCLFCLLYNIPKQTQRITSWLLRYNYKWKVHKFLLSMSAMWTWSHPVMEAFSWTTRIYYIIIHFINIGSFPQIVTIIATAIYDCYCTFLRVGFFLCQSLHICHKKSILLICT